MKEVEREAYWWNGGKEIEVLGVKYLNGRMRALGPLLFLMSFLAILSVN